MLYNVIVGLLRTGVGALVGLAVTWLLALGIELDLESQATLILVLATVVIGLYTALVNWLATKVHPAFGYLLGVPATPEYRAVAAKQADGQVVATANSPLETGELVYVAPVEPHDPAKVDNAEPYPY